MESKDDYLTFYREFFENFAQTVNPNDQLPVKLASYKLVNVEVVGGVIDWTTQYLTQKKCPQCLVAPLIQLVIQEMRKACKKDPVACGFNTSDNAYEPLKLMQTVMAKTNEICLRYLDNSMLCSLPSPTATNGLYPYNLVSVCAVKNRRRRMEDRHVVIHDLNTIFNLQEVSPSSYYAIFDGHAGHDAAAYSAAHLHQFLAESVHFQTNPRQALHDAFIRTDELFVTKCKVESFNSGTTAVCALLRPKEQILYIAWVGDSQAILVKDEKILDCVVPHKPCRQDEKDRIHTAGGYVTFWGTWRVNGQLAVSRAIGDFDYKPSVIATPDIIEIQLDNEEDFLILACDGMWDYLRVDDAARLVYEMVGKEPDKSEQISERLVHLAKELGSSDNISVIVVFLRDPVKLAAEAQERANRKKNTSSNSGEKSELSCEMDATLENSNPFSGATTTLNNGTTNTSSDNDNNLLLLNLASNFKQNGGNNDVEKSENVAVDDFLFGNNNEKNMMKKQQQQQQQMLNVFDEVDDFGPETNVDDGIINSLIVTPTDADDKCNLSPSILAAKALAEGIVNNNAAAAAANNPFNAPSVDNLINDPSIISISDDEEDEELMKTNKHAKEGENAEENVNEEVEQQECFERPTSAPLIANASDDGLIADSDSEDGWNYFKGEETTKPIVEEQDQVKNDKDQVKEEEKQEEEKEDKDKNDQLLIDQEEDEDDDNMSQLNPNAAEFVPVSPPRSIPTSPIHIAPFLNDHIISQSPKRATEIDITLPKNEDDFDNEVKSRPGECDLTTDETTPPPLSNGVNTTNLIEDLSETTTTTTNNVVMENLLNGKNLDDILEFQPLSPTNATASQPMSPQETAEEKKIDDNNLIELASQRPKESDDPMSMSFYQDKGGDGDNFLNEVIENKVEMNEMASVEAIVDDLNKVHMLPDNVDDYLNSKPEEEEEEKEKMDYDEKVDVVDNINIVKEEEHKPDLLIEHFGGGGEMNKFEQEIKMEEQQQQQHQEQQIFDLSPSVDEITSSIKDDSAGESPIPDVVPDEQVQQPQQEEVQAEVIETTPKTNDIDLILEKSNISNVSILSPINLSFNEGDKHNESGDNNLISVETEQETPANISQDEVFVELEKELREDVKEKKNEEVKEKESDDKSVPAAPVVGEAIAGAGVATVVAAAAAAATAAGTTNKSAAAPTKRATIGTSKSPAAKPLASAKPPAKKPTTAKPAPKTTTLGASTMASRAAKSAATTATAPKPTSSARSTGTIPKTTTATTAAGALSRPKPKTATTTASSARQNPIERKPLTNGSVKQTASSTARLGTVTRKPLTTTTSSAPTTRAASATTTTTNRTVLKTTTTTTASKSAGLSSKPASATAAPKSPRTTTTTTVRSTVTKTTTAAGAASSRPVTSPSKPRTLVRAAPQPTDKQTKDSANKLVASRKVESKVQSRLTTKKPVEATKTSPVKGKPGPIKSKPTSTLTTKVTKIEKKSMENGDVVKTEQITIVNNGINANGLLVENNGTSTVENNLINEITTPAVAD